MCAPYHFGNSLYLFCEILADFFYFVFFSNLLYFTKILKISWNFLNKIGERFQLNVVYVFFHEFYGVFEGNLEKKTMETPKKIKNLKKNSFFVELLRLLG